MSEIEEKDLEKASGGIDALSSGCEDFEARDKAMPSWRCPRLCGLCRHYVITTGVCDLGKGEQA